MTNGAAKKTLYAVLGTLFVAVVGSIGSFVSERASAEDVEKNSAAIAANAERQHKHELEATQARTDMQVNQQKIATSIDFLVRQQNPSRAPIAPTIVAPEPVATSGGNP